MKPSNKRYKGWWSRQRKVYSAILTRPEGEFAFSRWMEGHLVKAFYSINNNKTTQLTNL